LGGHRSGGSYRTEVALWQNFATFSVTARLTKEESKDLERQLLLF
jgi:hypothetical protein